MLPKLKSTSLFKKEFNDYKRKIEKIANPVSKDNAIRLLNDLIFQSNIIDEGHNPVTNSDIDPRRLRENVEKIVEIRQQITKIIKEAGIK